MKITKLEKIWLIVVIAFYVCYNLPLVPAYGNAKATALHAFLTLIPLWVAIYVGLILVCKKIRLKDHNNPPVANQVEATKNEEDASC